MGKSDHGRRSSAHSWHGGCGSSKPHCVEHAGTAERLHVGPALSGGQSQRPSSWLHTPRYSQPGSQDVSAAPPCGGTVCAAVVAMVGSHCAKGGEGGGGITSGNGAGGLAEALIGEGMEVMRITRLASVASAEAPTRTRNFIRSPTPQARRTPESELARSRTRLAIPVHLWRDRTRVLRAITVCAPSRAALRGTTCVRAHNTGHT